MNFLSHGKCNNYVVMLNNVVHVDVVVVRQTGPQIRQMDHMSHYYYSTNEVCRNTN